MTSRLLTSRSFLVAAVAAPLLLWAGCGKKEEPPPPPPPPPPPMYIPDTFDVEALRQELGTDARVQLARGIETTDRDLAEAVLRFADAWAKGDDRALRQMLVRSDRAILDDLRARGEWDAEVEKVEQVRIVYLSEHGADVPVRLPDMSTLIQQIGLPADLPDTAKQMMQGMMERMMTQMADDPGALAEAARQQLQDPTVRQQLEQAGMSLSQIEAGLQGLESGEAGGRISGPVVTLALQQPGEAYVLAWNATRTAGTWTFRSLHTENAVRRRASDWDGRAGLAGMIVAEADEVEAPPTPGATSPETGEAQQQDPGGPLRKQTPVGPVTIPGGSPGGSSGGS
jgi:hypothetical protein